MEPSTSLVLSALSALGVGALLKELVAGSIRHLSGRSERERTHHADALLQRDQAWAERNVEWERADRAERREDHARLCLRLVQEYASLLRRELTSLGAELPDWPNMPDEPK